MVTRLPKAIVDLDEFSESNNILIFSDTGIGKSVLVGQLYWHLAANKGKCLVISSEAGIFVAKKFLKAMGVTDAQIKRTFKVWPIRKWQDYEEAYIWVRDNPGYFTWVAMDSATSLQARAMRAAMEIAVKRSPEKRDIDLPDKGEHQKMQNAMKRMITDWNELPENILWLANAMRREDEEGEDLVLPFIMGKGYDISVWAAAQVHCCAYYEKVAKKVKGGVEIERRLWFNSPPPYWTKDRYGIWGDYRTMAIGYDQKTTLSELLDELAANPKAVKTAQRRVSEQDDDVDDEEEPEDSEDTEDTEDTEEEEQPVVRRKGRRGFRPATEEE